MSSPITLYKFDDIVIDLRNRQLNRNGETVTLNAKYFDVLAFLAGRPQQLISRDQLFEEIWQGLIVTDSALSQCIKDIRKALGDDAKNPRYIKTFPKKGFMFLKTPISVSEKEPAVPQAQGIQTVVKRPYKFLDYYTEEDTDLFYGRESEVRVICSKILSHRSFILYGRSGVGKSSLVHAGLIPSLKRMGHLAFSVRSFYDPFEEMVRVLSGDTPSGENLDLYQLLQQRIASPEQNVIFILDQFEEFFTLTHPEARDNFFRNIGEVFRQNRIQLRLVFAVREDYLAEMNQFKHILPEIFHHEYRLQRLSREQAERAITEPARKVNCDLEPPLVQMILDDLSDDEFVDPPQLQIVCDALYDLKEVEGRIPVAGYRRLGGASQILSRYLERVVQRFKGEEIDIVRAILGALISAKNQRLILPLSRLEERITYQSGDEKKVRSLVSELSDARIVRFRRQDGEIWVELTHDFLIPEISRWQSAELLALKQAHSLIERAVENYELHGLLMDDDTIDVISPLGSKLPLNENEAGLLGRSMLNRVRLVPEWLIRKFPSVTNLIREATRNENPQIRICAIESAEYGFNDDLLSILKEMALWDPDLNVRKAASIALAERFGNESKRWLLDKNSQPRPGIIRKAISIAFIRDHNKMLIWLRRLPPHIVLLVLSGLMWVRLRRNKMDILKETIGGAAGAGAAGLLTGFILGVTLVFFRQQPVFESTTLVLVLSSLGALAGLMAGLGISLGMATMQFVSYRHSPYWAILGAVAGGGFVGGSLHAIGVDTLRALFGQNLGGIAGAYEGALIGLGLSLGYLAGGFPRRRIDWTKIFYAALGAMMMAIILTLIQGNLFSASIETIAHSFSNSQVNLQPLAQLFGEAHFGRISRLILGALEGFLFGGGLTLGVQLLRDDKSEKR